MKSFKWPQSIIGVGVLLRVLAVQFMDIQQDGAAYVAMAHSWFKTKTFTLPYGEVYSRFTSHPEASHHYSPLFPVLLGSWYAFAGYGLVQSQAFNLVLSLATLVLVFFLTRDLYGHQAALWVTAILAVEPGFVLPTGTGFTENLILATFAFTMYCILKSLRNDWWLIGAGVGAAASYLTRSGMGSLFIIAGFGGLAWRFYYHGIKKTLSSPAYWIAASIFGSTILAWGYRNVRLFGWPHWETSAYMTYVAGIAYSHPLNLAAGLFFKLPLFLAFYGIYYLVFKKELRASLAKGKEEAISGLWLSIVLMFLIGWWLSSVFWISEATPIWWLDNHRYVVVAFLPLLWLVVMEAKVEKRGFQLRALVLCGVLCAGSIGIIAQPTQMPEVKSMQWLNPHLQHDTKVGLNGSLAKYVGYPYQARYDIQIVNCLNGVPCAENPDWLISRKLLEHPGNYTLAHEVHLPIYWGVTYLDEYIYQRT